MRDSDFILYLMIEILYWAERFTEKSLLQAAWYPMAEECRDTNDCSHVTCPENDYVLECHNRQCTCSHTTATCSAPSDCSGTGDNCRFGWHCIDTRCRCGFGFGGLGK
ncbi:hypothetical protein ACF0H5_018102 [Mactra antiquata]